MIMLEKKNINVLQTDMTCFDACCSRGIHRLDVECLYHVIHAMMAMLDCRCEPCESG